MQKQHFWQQPYRQPQSSMHAEMQHLAEATKVATPSGIQEIPSLEILSNVDGTRYTHQLIKPVISIGRDPTNDIVIDSSVVSHFHIQIVREGDHLTLVHPHPSQTQTINGLLYQGHHILGHEFFKKPLVHGDIFGIGNEHSILITLTYNDGCATPPDIRPAKGFASLEVASNVPGVNHVYDLSKPMINIGRDPTNDIVISAPVVSHFHAQIVRAGDHFTLIHPHPSQSHTGNGLLYQGRHILGHESFKIPLANGDVFGIGSDHGMLVTLTYNDGRERPRKNIPASRPLSVSAHVSAVDPQSLHSQAPPQAQVQPVDYQPSPPRMQSIPESRPLPASVPMSVVDAQSPHPQAAPQAKPRPVDHQPPKKHRPMNIQEKVARISAISAIVVAIITAILGPLIATGHIPFVFSPNPTSIPTAPAASPNTYPPAGWPPPVLNDSMASNSSGYWSVGDDQNGSCQFTNEAYQVSTKSSSRGYYCEPARNFDFTDLALEAQIMIVQGDQGAILFRTNATSGDYYWLWISSDGKYGFEIWANNNPSKSLGSGVVADLNTGPNQFNTVAVVAQANTFHLYINHKAIGVMTDPASTYTHGTLAFEAFATSNPTTILFRNVKVWTPPSS